MARNGAGKLARQAVGVGRIVKRDAIDADAFRLQVLRKMAHRRQQKVDLLLVMRHIARRFVNFDDQNDVTRRVEV